MKRLILLLAATVLFAETDTTSNGIRIRTQETTEGLVVFVTPSSCNTEAIWVQLRTSKVGGAWDMQQDTKHVIRCDGRPVEFRFLLPGEVLLIAATEMAKVNSGSAK